MSSKSWITQVRKGLLEMCILNLLAKEELYGYDLVKKLGELQDWDISGGTVYPILNRLKKEGSITSELRESDVGPVRKYYGLTPDGNEKLSEMNANWLQLNGMIKVLIGKNK
ncbi:MAG: PadR family transcriptional regulator [Planctomycetes bacterium]|nr:PadR family transcriptional regulator [Planctomycetota bacterium]